SYTPLAPFVQPPTFPPPLGREPQAGLKNRDYLGFEFLGERDGIMNMIGMRVRNQDRIDALELMALGIHGIALDPRIHHKHFASLQAELEGRVTKPGDLNHILQSNSGFYSLTRADGALAARSLRTLSARCGRRGAECHRRS